jgi:hypothetical protein
MMKSWKTTVLGILGIVTLIASAAKAVLDSDPTTNVDLAIFLPALFAAVTGLFAKDSNVTGGTVSNQQVVVPKA